MERGDNLTNKKKTISGVAHIDKLMVQKSLPLFSLWRSDLSLTEFKILDAYLSRINSHSPEQKRVSFLKGELETILGVSKINLTDLEKRLDHLMKTVVTIKDASEAKGFKKVNLFEEAEAELDSDTGFWNVNLECTTKAMKYFFNVDNLGYLRYKLRCITEITSRYTYIMFLYLESNRYRRAWSIKIDELKKILNCENDELYSEYKFFNYRILKKAHQELNQKTGCHFDYTPIKVGRKVVAIKFTVETLTDLMPSVIEKDTEPVPLNTYTDDTIEFYADACDGIFTQSEMELIMTAVRTKELKPHPQGIEFARYQYLEQKYKELKRQNEIKQTRGDNLIKDPCAYLTKMIERDEQ